MSIVQDNPGNVGLDRLSYFLSKGVYLGIYDRTDWFEEAVVNEGQINGQGSLVTRDVFYDEDGVDIWDDMVNEDDEVSPTEIEKDVVDMSVARKSFSRKMTGLYAITGDGWKYDIMRICKGMVRSYWATRMQMFADVIETATGTPVGNASGPAVVDDLYDASFALTEAMVDTEFLLATLKPKQWNDIIYSLRGEDGAIKLIPEVQEALRRRGNIARLLDMNIFRHARINSDGTSYKGGVFAPGAIVYRYGSPVPMQSLGGGHVYKQDAQMRVAIVRHEGSDTGQAYGHAYPGVKIREQGKFIPVNTGV